MKYSVSLETPLGPDAFVVRRLEGFEEMSEPFDFHVLCTSTHAVNPSKLLNHPATITFHAQGAQRHWHGLVTEFKEGASWHHAPGGVEGLGPKGARFYTLRLRPRLWLLTLSARCEIFQHQSAQEIIKSVLSRYGVTDVLDRTLSAGKRVRDYCVQYNESCFDFISRLMEEEGVFYFFKHDASKHTLVLGDHTHAYSHCKPESLIFRGEHLPSQLHDIYVCTYHQSLVSTAYQATDYVFQTPQMPLKVVSHSGHSGGKVYEYPGLYEKRAEGEKLADMRRQQLGCREKVLEGSSAAYGMSAGHRFTLKEHPHSSFNTSYEVLRVEHALTTSPQGDAPQYENTFWALPSTVLFRPPRKTPKPRIYGTQTAVVTGTAGEEIYMDTWGRIKVHFHWDQKNPKNETSSCWIRVAQSWAGSQWGGQYIPRVGQEVVVTYLEGDPDRPLVTGSVYNGDHPLPYGPDAKTKSTLKSSDYKGGGGFNEIRFDDQKDQQEIFVHAERHYHTIVKRGNRSTILQADEGKKVQDSLTIVKGDRTTTFKEGNETHTLEKGDQTLALKKGERHVSVEGGDETHKNDQNFTHTVQKDYTLTIQGNLVIDVTGKITIKSGDQISVKSGSDTQVKAGAGVMIEASSTLTAKAGAMSTLQGGAGVTVKGPIVKIGS